MAARTDDAPAGDGQRPAAASGGRRPRRRPTGRSTRIGRWLGEDGPLDPRRAARAPSAQPASRSPGRRSSTSCSGPPCAASPSAGPTVGRDQATGPLGGLARAAGRRSIASARSAELGRRYLAGHGPAGRARPRALGRDPAARCARGAEPRSPAELSERPDGLLVLRAEARRERPPRLPAPQLLGAFEPAAARLGGPDVRRPASTSAALVAGGIFRGFGLVRGPVASRSGASRRTRGARSARAAHATAELASRSSATASACSRVPRAARSRRRGQPRQVRAPGAFGVDERPAAERAGERRPGALRVQARGELDRGRARPPRGRADRTPCRRAAARRGCRAGSSAGRPPAAGGRSPGGRGRSARTATARRPRSATPSAARPRPARADAAPQSSGLFSATTRRAYSAAAPAPASPASRGRSRPGRGAPPGVRTWSSFAAGPAGDVAAGGGSGEQPGDRQQRVGERSDSGPRCSTTVSSVGAAREQPIEVITLVLQRVEHPLGVVSVARSRGARGTTPRTTRPRPGSGLRRPGRRAG